MAKDKEARITQVLINGVTWTPELVKQKIATSDQAVKNALLRVYSWQTEEEQQAEQTIEPNRKGFNGLDGKILSSFAEQLKNKGWLSAKQVLIARKKLLKYSRQIFENHIVHQRQLTYDKFKV
jgi:hypothetical protein